MNNYTRYVNPFIGTSGECRWSYFTPAALPFGMIKLAPVTYGYGGYAGGGNPTGYDYRHKFIYGFSHLHESQMGAFLTMPCVGTLRTTPGSADAQGSGFGSRFNKANERAEPGYYGVFLEDCGVKVELSATTRVGFHRYTFPQTDEAYILFDIGHNLGESGLAGKPVNNASIAIISEREVAGSVVICPAYIGRAIPVYFCAEFSVPFVRCGTFKDADIYREERMAKGPGIGAFFHFNARHTPIVEFKLAVSFVSVEQAHLNMKAESDGWTFNRALENAKGLWNRALGRIEVEGESEEDKTKFYTSLWHVLLGKGICSDVDGKYVNFNDRPAQIMLKDGMPEYSHYNTDADWGSWWNKNQILALIYPETMNSFARCLIDIYEESGWMPDGLVCDKPNPGMPINHVGAFIACAYNHGIRKFNVENAFDAVYKNITAFKNRPEKMANPAIEQYSRLGFVPIEVKTYGPSGHTLEYAFEDWCVAQLAQALGKPRESNDLRKRSENYKNLFDPETKFMRPRKSDGAFINPFDPMQAGDFAEGNAWQYTWYVPHDIAGLIRLMGKATFNSRLNLALEVAAHSTFSGLGNTGGYCKIYNQGNEPDLQVPYLFNYSGKPWLTQYWTRRIMDEFYGATPGKGYGYDQDDDQGQLSGWFVLSAMGIFDVRGAAGIKPSYQIGSPLFRRVTVHMNEDFYPVGQFVIDAEGNSAINRYVQTAMLNDKILNGPWFFLEDLLKAGNLKLRMGKHPNKKWGNRTVDAPPSMSKE